MHSTDDSYLLVEYRKHVGQGEVDQIYIRLNSSVRDGGAKAQAPILGAQLHKMRKKVCTVLIGQNMNVMGHS